ncbi:GntR family transcriptional regulator [Streptomyces chartreusis]|uniref:GntR family transcriptional regulator n=1 Tax=Streptomyces chartreusis TaxID=1969 RepID=A0A7I0Y8X4_STRCX|nr:GntR family transcriptional regulator [Streptomyces chartreusis]QKZ15955.1 GntR family transcriptional regulator [Streptomyces chartreusis]
MTASSAEGGNGALTWGKGNAPERVAGILRDELFDGALPPGTRLREEELCDRFGLGRHTIRAALRLMADRRLISHERNRGAFVPELTQERIDELFGFRKVLEEGSLRLALAEGADLGGVTAAVEALEALPEETSWRELTETHGRIHLEIVAAAGNAHLLETYQGCMDELRVMLAVIRPDFSVHRFAALHRHLLDQLHIGGEVAIQALMDDIELSGRAALLKVLHRAQRLRPVQPPAELEKHRR